MAKIPLLSIAQFELDEFYENNAEHIEYYAELRIRGIHSRAAFSRVFGHHNATYPDVVTKIDLVESSEVYNEHFERLLKSTPIDKLLDERRALHGYLDIAGNPQLKESVRVAALKEACVLAGVTTIDDAGRSQKAPRTLADFYAEVERREGMDENGRWKPPATH